MAGILLDTHIFLWWAEDPSVLPSKIQHTIDHNPEVYLSVAVAWEIEIKQAKGKLDIDPFDWSSILLDKKLIPLQVSFHHMVTLRQLPMLHRDPFDRILIAQAKADNLTLVTHDKLILQYPDVTLLKV